MLSKVFTRTAQRVGARGFSSTGVAAQEAARQVTRENVRVNVEQTRRPRIVSKFGGSSVGNSQAISSVVRHLIDQRKQGASPISVTSALYGVTDRLVAALEGAVKGDEAKVAEMREKLLLVHERTANELLTDFPGLLNEAMGLVHGLMEDEYDAVLRGVLERGATASNDVDIVSSLGERLSTHMVAAHMKTVGQASEYFAGDALVVTDGIPGNSKPLLEPTVRKVREKLVPLLDDGVIPCVTGFFGASEGGMLTTFGRGGSDLTAAVLGHALDASEVALYKVEYEKDDDGFLAKWQPGWEGVVHDADPTKSIEDLSYEAAGTLAHFGKEVLHPETVSPAVSKKIPILVKNTLNPNNPGTAIRPADEVSVPEGRSHPVLAITKAHIDEYSAKHNVEIDFANADGTLTNVSSDDASLLVLAGTNVMDSADEVVETATAALDKANIQWALPKEINGSKHHISIAVPKGQVKESIRTVHPALFPDVPLTRN